MVFFQPHLLCNYEQAACTKADPSIFFSTTSLSVFFPPPCCYSGQQWSLLSVGGEGSPLAEHNSAAGRIPQSTLTVLIGKSNNFLFFQLRVEGKKIV
ncbi:hypothetical protein AB205_0025800 [Aquarana catesbeiana]|uniref:Uncharacterized protein n=1 Tax=Aquarana catesbeiana TaxID=8400 RepID=A0A2G9S4Y0_AQUCT|nr:hypothetical protein AB205_0025800 [Aquarana catesbeiana]